MVLKDFDCDLPVFESAIQIVWIHKSLHEKSVFQSQVCNDPARCNHWHQCDNQPPGVNDEQQHRNGYSHPHSSSCIYNQSNSDDGQHDHAAHRFVLAPSPHGEWNPESHKYACFRRMKEADVRPIGTPCQLHELRRHVDDIRYVLQDWVALNYSFNNTQ